MNKFINKLFDIRMAELSTHIMLFIVFLLLLARGITYMIDLPLEVSNLFLIPLREMCITNLGVTIFLLIGNIFKRFIPKQDI